jgi:alginate O-acetyltransferase complex protein AlgI
MLFTTLAFALGFLPLVFAGFFLLGRRWPSAAAAWLFLASLFFYGYWMPRYTVLLLASIVVNFTVGRAVAEASATRRARARALLICGVVFNLGLLSYFKYANFLVDSVNAVLGSHWQLASVTLPIGISFFTFTQLAFLADAYHKGVKEYRPAHYGLFVTYFPHLVAGPVLHHAQMMPQFGEASTYRVNAANVAAGLAIFAIGLGKKIVFADGVSPYADAVFNAAHGGTLLQGSEAWLGALAYTFQLYFDFSGYSDMAVGLSLLFNIRLPYNFNSPYRSLNISDFWRRWHMSLSTFLRDYLYIPLGGNRCGGTRRYVNLMLTMLLGGLWHGANWTFVMWGGLHGLYLGFNHGYRAVLGARLALLEQRGWYRVLAWAVTFCAVVVAWVLFRAPDFATAATLLWAMAGQGAAIADASDSVVLWNAGLTVAGAAGHCAVLGAIAVLLPNSNALGERLLARYRRAADLCWLGLGAALVSCLFLLIINDARDAVSPFIYFNF